MLVFSSYDNCFIKGEMSISYDGGKSVGFTGEVCQELAPSQDLMVDWAFYQGRCSEETINRMFAKRYYEEVLANLDIEKVYKMLENKVIVDYDGCPTRQILMAWTELLLGIKNFSFIQVEGGFVGEGPQAYIKSFLENIIINTQEMYGFKSCQAAFLYGRAIELEEKAISSEEPGMYDLCMQSASFLRCDADEAEQNYLSGVRNQQLSTEKSFVEVNAAEVWLEEQGHRLRFVPSREKAKRELKGQMSL